MYNVERIRSDFPFLVKHPEMIYLDNAATSLRPTCVMQAMNTYYEDISANAHRGDYQTGFRMNEELDACREEVRCFLGAQRVDEVIFTGGSTAGLNMIALGYGMKHLKEGDVILTTEAEHASGILPWMKVAERVGAQIGYIPLNEDGSFSIENYSVLLTERVKVVVLSHVTNVLGFLLPMKKICEMAHSVGAVVICDGSQSVPHMPINVVDLDVDFLTFSAHKLCGPTGIGVLYGKAECLANTDPVFYGGGSNAGYTKDGTVFMKQAPEKFESGTLPLAEVFGLRAAIRYLSEIGMDEIRHHEQSIRAVLTDGLATIPHVRIYNANADTGILTMNFRQIHGADAAKVLDHHHIAVRAGEHCSKLLEPRFGTNTTVRVTPYLYTTKQEAERFLQVCEMATKDYCLKVLFLH